MLGVTLAVTLGVTLGNTAAAQSGQFWCEEVGEFLATEPPNKPLIKLVSFAGSASSILLSLNTYSKPC